MHANLAPNPNRSSAVGASLTRARRGGPVVAGQSWLHDIVYNVAKFPWEPPEIDSCVDMEI
jgi:hypothetical protein